MKTTVEIEMTHLACFDAHRATDEIIEKFRRILQKFSDENEIQDFTISEKQIEKTDDDIWTKVGE